MKLLVGLSVVLFIQNAFGAITYQLYTKMNMNMGQPLTYMNTNSVYSSNYNSAKKNKYEVKVF